MLYQLASLLISHSIIFVYQFSDTSIKLFSLIRCLTKNAHDQIKKRRKRI